MTVRAIDCWVNVNMSGLGRPEYLKEVAKNYFKQERTSSATTRSRRS